MIKDPEYLAIEVEGVSALVNSLALQYSTGSVDHLGEDQNEKALYSIGRQLDRIAEDLRALSINAQ